MLWRLFGEEELLTKYYRRSAPRVESEEEIELIGNNGYQTEAQTEAAEPLQEHQDSSVSISERRSSDKLDEDDDSGSDKVEGSLESDEFGSDSESDTTAN